MSDDLIRRSDAIKAMEQRYQDILKLFKRKVKDGEKAIVLDMIGCIKTLPSADRPQEWIPCSERLPEENKRVLITTARGYMNIGWIKQNIWSTDLIVNLQDFVIAWMPLPKPWKGADADGERSRR